MIVVTLSRAVVYVTTGVFFAVAAMAQLHGDSVPDTFLKAGIACVLLSAIGMVVLRIVEDTVRKAAEAERRPKDTAPAAEPSPQGTGGVTNG